MCLKFDEVEFDGKFIMYQLEGCLLLLEDLGIWISVFRNPRASAEKPTMYVNGGCLEARYPDR
jgi:hypothetical protein